MTNKDEIFCLIGSFLNRLNKDDIFFKDDGHIFILDRIKGSIVNDLSKIYTVKGVDLE